MTPETPAAETVPVRFAVAPPGTAAKAPVTDTAPEAERLPPARVSATEPVIPTRQTVPIVAPEFR